MTTEDAPTGRPAIERREEPAGAPGASPPNARPSEIEELLNRRFVHPLSRVLVDLLIPTGITPNAVSVLGVVMMCAACACYGLLAWPLGPLLGFVFHVGWHVFDGADGQLARRTGRSSPIGEIVDGVCDHVSHVVLYVTLALILVPRIGGWALALAAVSGGSRALQSMCYETARRSYRRWMYDVSWIRQDLGRAGAQAAGGAGRAGVFLAGLYLRLSSLVRADDGAVDAAMARALAGPAGQADRARALYRREALPLVKRAQWLSANYENSGRVPEPPCRLAGLVPDPAGDGAEPCGGGRRTGAGAALPAPHFRARRARESLRRQAALAANCSRARRS